MFEGLDRTDAFAAAKEHEFFQEQIDMSNTTTESGPWNADNITTRQIDLAAFALNEAKGEIGRLWSLTEQLWKDAQYGAISTAEAAEKLNGYAAKVADLTMTLHVAFNPTH